MACCASTSPKVLTSIGTVLATLLLSRPHSTADRGRLSVGEPHPKPSTNCYSHTSEDVLRRPLEPGVDSPMPSSCVCCPVCSPRTKGAVSSTGPTMRDVLHTYEHDLQGFVQWVPDRLRFGPSPFGPASRYLLLHPLLQTPARRAIVTPDGEPGKDVAYLIRCQPFGHGP